MKEFFQHSRYTAFERQWDIFFFLARADATYTINQIHAMFNCKWHKKTIQRDMFFLEKYGVVKRRIENEWRFSYDGPKGPFVKTKHKFCLKCKRTKLLDDFHKMWSGVDGRKPYCKECVRKIQKRHYDQNRDYVLSRQRMRRERMNERRRGENKS